MNKLKIFQKILSKKKLQLHNKIQEFAPINIAVIKYWGKRDEELNLANNPSLSFSVNNFGCTTNIKISNENKILVNGKIADENFTKKTENFVNFWRNSLNFLEKIEINFEFNIAIGEGLASSAAGFASLTKALNRFFGTNLKNNQLSILARLGSGSACRSFYKIAKWKEGKRRDGMDSFAIPVNLEIKDLYIGFIIISTKTKLIASRDGMKLSQNNSVMYEYFIKHSKKHIKFAIKYLKDNNFLKFGEIIEENCLMMHSTNVLQIKHFDYFSKESYKIMQKIQNLRKKNDIQVYFTADAGENIKIFFQEANKIEILKHFPSLLYEKL